MGPVDDPDGAKWNAMLRPADVAEMRAKAEAFDAALEKFKTINGSFTYSDEQWWFVEEMKKALAEAKRKGEGR